MCRKRQKKEYADVVGRTIANMNVEGFKWYVSDKEKKNRESMKNIQLTKKESRAIMKGALMAYFPAFLMIIIGFSIAFLIIYAWLGGFSK